MSSDIQLPLIGSISKQTTAVFAAGLLVGLSTLYLPTLLFPPLHPIRSLLFLAYPLTTTALALTTWWTTRHQPSLSPLSSLRANSPLRYSYLILLATLCVCQLLFASRIAHSIGASVLLYLGQLLAYFPIIVHTLLSIAHTYHIPVHSRSPLLYVLAVVAVLVCVGVGFPYVGSEYALSRRDAGMAWYVLRVVVEVCYSLMMVASVIDNNNGSAAAGGAGVRSEWLVGAHVVRIALWAALAYVCRLYANGKTRLF